MTACFNSKTGSSRKGTQPSESFNGAREREDSLNSNHVSLSRGLVTAAFVGLLLSACAVRSISNSGYYADPDHGYGRQDNPLYKGELSEFNVLGIDAKAAISEADIQDALASKRRFSLPRGASVMLVQSGAIIPDAAMVSGLEKYYSVAVFSGVPDQPGATAMNYSRALRLAAARGGHEKLVVYWGLLESGRENLATKVVSWFPFVGGFLPDETQRMRIRLKVAVIDVKTGQWEMFAPDPFEDADSSGRYSRVSADQAQVALLKDKGYRAAAEDLVKRFGR